MSEIPFKKDIDELFREILFESWMDESDYEELLELVFKSSNLSYESLSKSIQSGIDKGFSLEFQLLAVKKKFKNKKDE